MSVRPVHPYTIFLLLIVATVFAIPIGSTLQAQTVPPGGGTGSGTPGGTSSTGGGGNLGFPEPPLTPVIFEGFFREHSVDPTLGVAQQVIPGDFDGDTVNDLWLLHGGTLELLTSVDILAIGHTVTIQASAAVGVRQEESDRDELIWSGAGGLNLSTFQEDQSLSTQYLGHSEWDGATELKLCSIGGTPAYDLIGLSPSGLVLVLFDVLTDAPFSSRVSIFGMPRELEVLNWDAKGDQEVVVRSTEGIFVHDPRTGHLLARGEHRVDAGVMTVAHHPVIGEVVFWITRDSVGDAEIMVIFSQTFGLFFKTIRYLDGPHDPGIGSITAADINGDYIPEIAMRCGHDGKVLLLRGGHPDLYPDVAVDAGEPYYQELDGFPGDGNQGEVLFTDFDRDGDSDLVWSCNDGETLRQITCREINEVAFSPLFERIFFDDYGVGNEKFLRIQFLNPPRLDPEPGLRLQAMLFRKQDALGQFDSAIPMATFSQPYKEIEDPFDPVPIVPADDLSDGIIRYPFEEEYIPQPEWETPYPIWEIPLTETEWVFPAVYWLMVRYVKTERGPNGNQIVDSYPAQAFYFTGEGYDQLGAGGSLDALLNQKDWTNWSPVGPVHGPNQDVELSSVPTVIDGGKGGDKELPKDTEPGFNGV